MSRLFGFMSSPNIPVQRPVKVGIGRVENGNYYIVLEAYYENFKTACEKLLTELKERDTTPTKSVSTGAFSSTRSGISSDTDSYPNLT